MCFFPDLPNGQFPSETTTAEVKATGCDFLFSNNFLELFNALISLIKKGCNAVASFFTPQEAAFVLIAPGTQNDSEGSIDSGYAEETCTALNHDNASPAIFNSDRISNPISGGTCSAMTFTVAYSYINFSATHENQPEKHIKILPILIPNGSNLAYRTQQAVFNTIERSRESGDFKKDKMESLSGYFDLTISYASQEIDLSKGTAQADIKDVFSKIPEGIFIIRTLLPSDNHKEEEHGHSMLLIKQKDASFFYDPNKGLFQLGKELEGTALYGFLDCCYKSFATSSARLYQVVKSNRV